MNIVKIALQDCSPQNSKYVNYGFESCLTPLIFFLISFYFDKEMHLTQDFVKVSKGAKIRNRYNQVPHLTQDTNWKVTNSQLDTTNESQEVSPFPAGDHIAHKNRRAQRNSKHKTEKIKIHKRSTPLERSVKYFTGGLKPLLRRQPRP